MTATPSKTEDSGAAEVPGKTAGAVADSKAAAPAKTPGAAADRGQPGNSSAPAAPGAKPRRPRTKPRNRPPEAAQDTPGTAIEAVPAATAAEAESEPETPAEPVPVLGEPGRYGPIGPLLDAKYTSLHEPSPQAPPPVIITEGQRREWDKWPTVITLRRRDQATTAAWEAEAKAALAREARPLTPLELECKEWLLGAQAARREPPPWKAEVIKALSPPGMAHG